MSRPYPNYNTRTLVPLSEIRDWRDKTGTAVRVYEDFDGGGFNHYIVEFRIREDLDAFMNQFPTIGKVWEERAPPEGGE